MLPILISENEALKTEIQEKVKQVEVNNRLIAAIKEKTSTTDGGQETKHPQHKAHGVSLDDYGWLSTAVKDYISACGGAEFNPTVMLDDITTANPGKPFSRTSIYPILKRMAANKEIVQTQKAIGRKPSYYKAVKTSRNDSGATMLGI